MKDKVKDVTVRALKTFWQAALAALAVTLPATIEAINAGANRDVYVNALISVATGAIAAGFSAVFNGVIKPLISSGKTAVNSTAGTPAAGTVSPPSVPTATEPTPNTPDTDTSAAVTEPAETIPTGKEPTADSPTVAATTAAAPDASAICDKPEVT